MTGGILQRRATPGPRPCRDCGALFDATPAVLWCEACGKQQLCALYARVKGVSMNEAAHILETDPERYIDVVGVPSASRSNQQNG